MPWRAMSLIRSMNACRATKSSPRVGSSSTSTFGSCTSARAIRTRRASPVDIVFSVRAANGAGSFGQSLTKALDSLQGAQAKADRLAVSAATGDLTNVHDYVIAATEASLATQLTVAVRNKAVEAFNQIMNMGV